MGKKKGGKKGGSKKSGKKKGKGKKSKGKKGKKTAVEEVELVPPKWPWHNASQWFGAPANEMVRNPLRRQFRERCLGAGEASPVYSTEEWTRTVRHFSTPYSDAEAELMIRLLVSVMGFEGDRKRPPDDYQFFAAAIRMQKNAAACKRMYDVLAQQLAQLDQQPHIDTLVGLTMFGPGHAAETPPFATTHAAIAEALEHAAITMGCKRALRRREAQRRYNEYVAGGDFPWLQASVFDAGGAASGKEAWQSVKRATMVGIGVETLTSDVRESARTSVIAAMHDQAMDEARSAASKGIKKLEYNDSTVKAFWDLQDAFHELAGNDDELLSMWDDIDLNGNKLAGLNELDVFVRLRYPILAGQRPLYVAFHQTVSSRKFAEGEEEELRDSVGSSIMRREFRAFMLRLFYFSKLWCALKRIDADDDDRLSFDEYCKGCKSLRSDLQLEEKLKPTREAWRSILDDASYGEGLRIGSHSGHEQRGEGLGYIGFCNWYCTQAISSGDDALADVLADWFPPDPPPSLDPLKLDLEAFQDLVLHCHYVTRE